MNRENSQKSRAGHTQQNMAIQSRTTQRGLVLLAEYAFLAMLSSRKSLRTLSFEADIVPGHPAVQREFVAWLRFSDSVAHICNLSKACDKEKTVWLRPQFSLQLTIYCTPKEKCNAFCCAFCDCPRKPMTGFLFFKRRVVLSKWQVKERKKAGSERKSGIEKKFNKLVNIPVLRNIEIVFTWNV